MMRGNGLVVTATVALAFGACTLYVATPAAEVA